MTNNLLDYSSVALQGADQLRVALATYRSQVSPEFTDLVDGYGQLWPTMTPELAFGLAAQGIRADSSEAAQIAELEGLQLQGQTTDHGGLLSLPGRAVGAAAGFVGDVLSPVSGAVTGATRFVTRTGFTVLESALEDLVKRPLRALAGAASASASQFDPDSNDSLFDDVLDTFEVLLDPSFYGGILTELPEQFGRAGQSDFAELLGRAVDSPFETLGGLVTGSEDVLGSGFLPGGDVRATAQAGREQIRIGGAGADFGDLILTGVNAATGLAEPGESAHNLWSGLLQMGFDIGADPFSAVSQVTRATRAARTGLGATQTIAAGGRLSPLPRLVVGATVDASEVGNRIRVGLVDGTRQGVLPDVVDAFVHSDEFTPVAEQLRQFASNGSQGLYDMNRALRNRLSPDRLAQLRDAALAGDTELRSVVSDLIQRTNVGNFSLASTRPRSRWGTLLPERSIDLRLGASELSEQLDRVLVATKVSPEARAGIFERFTAVDDAGRAIFTDGPIASVRQRAEARQIALDAMKLVDGQLTETMLARAAARTGGELAPGAAAEVGERVTEMTSLWRSWMEDSAFLADAVADDQALLGLRDTLQIAGAPEQSGIRLAAEVAQQIPLPDMQPIMLEMTSGALSNRFFRSAFERELAVSDAVLSVWVPMKLARLAWTVRVVGEEQIRMAAAGFDSMFRHPGSAIAWAMGRKGRTPDELLEELSVQHQRALNDVSANPNALAPSRHVATGQHRLARRVGANGRAEPGYALGHGLALRKLHDTPLTRRLAAEGAETADVADWFFESGQFDEWLSTLPHEDAIAIRNATDGGRTVSDAYVAYSQRLLQVMTGGSNDLRQFVSTGRLGRVNLREVRPDQIEKDLVAEMRPFIDDVNFHGPDTVPTPVYIKDPRRRADLDKFTRRMFQTLMGTPSNVLSRNPTFRQSYWRRQAELAGQMTPEAQRDLIRFAKESFRANDDELATILNEINVAQGGADAAGLTFAQADRLAQARALDTTVDLLYDQARRGLWSEMLRGVFVFAEAWREIGTTWTKLAAANPNIVNRAGSGVREAREAGIFYTDETTGEERFAYPGGSWVAGWLPGNAGLTGSVQGLNLFSTSVTPGFGPVVQIAASKVLPSTSDFDWMRELILPFGEIDVDTPGGFLDDTMPAWMRSFGQFLTAGGLDGRQFANAQMDVARALALENPEAYQGRDGQERLLADSRNKARMMFLFRAAVGGVAPTSPKVEFYGDSPSSESFTFGVLASEYFDLLVETGSDAEATRLFEQRFGIDPTYIRQAKTRAIRERSLSPEGAAWERDNADLVARYRDVIGFFAPVDDSAGIDFAAYDRAIESGDRQALTPDQMLQLANRRAGAIAYERAVERIEALDLPSDQRTDLKRAMRSQLAEQYPGFAIEVAGVGARLTTEQRIDELSRAVENEVLAATPQGQGVAAYLRDRDRILQVARSRGLTTLASDKVADLRALLNALGERYSTQYEGFGLIFDQVLSRELD